jgi:tungstate transport system substrate-binding protein
MKSTWISRTQAITAALAILVTAGMTGCRDTETVAEKPRVLKLATTTSTYETGLLDYIFPPFEKAHNVKVHIIPVGTGKAIKLAENGDVDVILVHARAAEDKFLADGYGINRRDVMYNDFVILGPTDDPARISGLKDAVEALRRIQAGSHAFVSRGDDSGTHKKEMLLWKQAGLTPSGDWYVQVGQGMSATLRIADEKNGYVMVDRATYLFNKDKMRVVKLVEGDKVLLNPYGVIPVNPYRHAHAEYELAMALAAWLTSPACQDMIAEYKKEGYQLYHPSADPAKTME